MASFREPGRDASSVAWLSRSLVPMMVDGVVPASSVGVYRYAQRLAVALNALGADYLLRARPGSAPIAHFHLANSTRRLLPWAALYRRPFAVTVHDVIPRARALRPLQQAVVAPLCVRRARVVIVHSDHAARMLATLVDLPADSVKVIPHPASEPPPAQRAAARAALGIEPDGPPLFVLPGVLKPAKLVAETVDAAAPLMAAGQMRLLLAGRVGNRELATRALGVGASVLASPDNEHYAWAIAAADAVVSVRANSVGENNGPLLDALGAGRPALVSSVGSGPETAGDAARVVAPTTEGIRAGLVALLDDAERRQRSEAALRRAAELTWEQSALAHMECFQVLLD